MGILRASTHWYETNVDLENYLKLLHKEMAEATARSDSILGQATAYNIIHVMREIERDKYEKETRALQFKLRDIVTHATEGNLSPKEALEKLRKLV